MSDYLSRLAGRSLGQELVLQPRLASRYEPVHNQPYQPFLPHFEWASSAVKAGDMESGTEMTESGPTRVPYEHLPSEDNQDIANDHSGSSTRGESSALHELGSNRPYLKHSKALFNQRLPSRLKKQSNSNKAIDKGALQQQQQTQQKHKLESNGHDRSATKKSSPVVARTDGKENLSQREDQGRQAFQESMEIPVNPKDHSRDRLANSMIPDLSSIEHIYKVDPGKANDKAVVDRKKEVSQAISPQIKYRNALIDQTYLIDRSYPLKDEDGLELTINASSEVVGLSKEIDKGQIRNTGWVPNKSQIRILGIKGAKTSSLPIVKGSAKSDVSEDGELPDLDLVSKKINRSADQGLSSSGTIRAREMPRKEIDSLQPGHRDIFLESGMTLSLNRFWPESPYLRIPGKKEDSSAKITAPEEEITGRPTPSEPQIQITIGRVEVRAISQQTPSPKRSNTATSSLEEYLRRRSGGIRG